VHWAVFIGTGVMGALAHLCMISAFNRAEASLLAPHNYTKIIWVAVLGYVLFDDVPSLNMWVGTAVIVSAGVYVLYRERRGA
jgi:drug/metabolite transporter (DMT)-like permease